MTFEEINRRYEVSLDTLHEFEEAGLFTNIKRIDQRYDFTDQDIENLSCILSLYQIGMDLHDVNFFLDLKRQGDKTKAERVFMLKKIREKALVDLHRKQKNLDCIDCMIYELKK